MRETQIDLIRHGDPLGGPRYRGHAIDDPLSAKGWRQMREAVRGLGGWRRIVSSPLRRCADFARELAAERRLPLTIEADLREVGFGAWEGKTKDELRALDAEAFAAFYRDPVHHRPPGAEPLDTFVARVSDAIDRLAAEQAGEPMLIVAHAGVLRAALVHAIAAPPACMYRIEVRNAALLRLRARADGCQLAALHNGDLATPF